MLVEIIVFGIIYFCLVKCLSRANRRLKEEREFHSLVLAQHDETNTAINGVKKKKGSTNFGTDISDSDALFTQHVPSEVYESLMPPMNFNTSF